jgi:hypothetical protein
LDLLPLFPSKQAGFWCFLGAWAGQIFFKENNFISLDEGAHSLFVGTLSLKYEGCSLKVILCDPMNGSPINFFENINESFI